MGLSSNFDIQIAAMRRQADADRHAIRSEMVAMHREFAEEAAMAVEKRVEEVVGRHADLLRAELEHKDDQIAELREVIFGFAQACRALTERPALTCQTGTGTRTLQRASTSRSARRLIGRAHLLDAGIRLPPAKMKAWEPLASRGGSSARD